MIQHPHPPTMWPNKAFVFANLFSISCSVCAPRSWTAEQVEAFATEQVPMFKGLGQWEAVDKSTLGLGSPTPHPCQHDEGRQHWFLMRDGSKP